MTETTTSGIALRLVRASEGLAAACATQEATMARQSFALHRIWCVVQGLPVSDGPLPSEVPPQAVADLVVAKWSKLSQFASAFQTIDTSGACSSPCVRDDTHICQGVGACDGDHREGACPAVKCIRRDTSVMPKDQT